MKLKNLILLFGFILILSFFSTSVFADITIDMPDELISGKVEKVTLNINDPLIEMYCNKIELEGSYVNFATKTHPKPAWSSVDMEYTGQKKVNFFVEADYSNTEDIWNHGKITVEFYLDEEKMLKDYPDMFIPITGARIEKKVDIVASKTQISLPKVDGEFNYSYFTSDRYEYASYGKSIDSFDFDNSPIYLRSYVFELESGICTGDVSDDLYYMCSAKVTQAAIDAGSNDVDTIVKKVNLHGGSGYAVLYAYPYEPFAIYPEGGEKFNAAIVTLKYEYSVLNEKEGTEYFGYIFKEGVVKEGYQDVFINEAIKEIEVTINSTVIKKLGSALHSYPANYTYSLSEFKVPDDFEDEDSDLCSTDDDCDDKLFCSACGECKKKLVNPSLVDLEIELSNKLSSKSIYNSVYKKAMITTKINPTFKVDGKKIKYCDIAAPGIKKTLVAKMTNNETYSGFSILGTRNVDLTNDEKVNVDFSKKPLEYHFVIIPNDKKKVVGTTGDIVENIELSIGGLAVSNIKLLLKEVPLDIDFKSSSKQMQQDSDKLVKITVDDKYTKKAFLKMSILGPGDITLKKYLSKKVYTVSKPNEMIKLLYHSPKLGNFDIAKEVASLSMVNLQTEAAKQIAEDVALAYAGDMFQGMEDIHNAERSAKMSKAGINAVRGFFKRNPAKYDPTKVAKYIKGYSDAYKNSKKADLIAKSYKIYSGTYGLTQVPKGTVGMRDDMSDVINKKNPPSKKTWAESVSEYGIVAIDIAQMGVGILTFVPNKIPGIRKVTAAGKSAFSAMTNIWKANFKYIAKSEKIDRAEERSIPSIILVTAQDQSGWTITKGYIIQVVYNEI